MNTVQHELNLNKVAYAEENSEKHSPANVLRWRAVDMITLGGDGGGGGG